MGKYIEDAKELLTLVGGHTLYDKNAFCIS